MALTFHRILAGCQAGERDAWLACVREYTPLMRGILGTYTPLSPVECDHVWRDCLRDLSGNGAARLKSLARPSEREFLLELRVLVLTQAARLPKPESGAPGVEGPTFEAIRDLLKDLPLLHQVIVFLKLAGYTDGSIERMLRVTPAEARRGLERLEAGYPAALRREKDACLWPRAWLELLARAWAAGTEACAPARQMIRILDGHTSWYDKEPVEQHTAGCLTCLERWAALREIVFWRRVASPLSENEAAHFVPELSWAAPSAGGSRKRSLIARLFG